MGPQGASIAAKGNHEFHDSAVAMTDQEALVKLEVTPLTFNHLS